jgi:hypothetical protein
MSLTPTQGWEFLEPRVVARTLATEKSPGPAQTEPGRWRPQIRERIVNGGSTPIEPPYTAEQWTEQYRREIGQRAELVRAGGIKVE